MTIIDASHINIFTAEQPTIILTESEIREHAQQPEVRERLERVARICEQRGIARRAIVLESVPGQD